MRKILIVEDEDVLREAYEIILSTEPYEIHVAANGKEAFNRCMKTKYDLILLDLMMPIMDGVGFLEKLSAKALNHPKVIVLSNLSSGKELELAKKYGAYKNILKSDLSPKELLSVVRYELEAT